MISLISKIHPQSFHNSKLCSPLLFSLTLSLVSPLEMTEVTNRVADFGHGHHIQKYRENVKRERKCKASEARVLFKTTLNEGGE